MTNQEIFILIVASAAIQASFQLSVSMVTVMSGHALGRKTALDRLERVDRGLYPRRHHDDCAERFVYRTCAHEHIRHYADCMWSIVSGLMVGIGLAVWLFYYDTMLSARYSGYPALWQIICQSGQEKQQWRRKPLRSEQPVL